MELVNKIAVEHYNATRAPWTATAQLTPLRDSTLVDPLEICVGCPGHFRVRYPGQMNHRIAAPQPLCYLRA